MTKLDSILKSRDITLPTNVRLVKVMVFPVVMYGCESWTIKKAEPRIDALELWCCRTLLRRRQWHPTPVLLPGKSRGRRSLVGCSSWGRYESDPTERLHFHFPATFFPVVTYGSESWTVKKAEHQRVDAFELWCWRRLLRVPWRARRSNQSILKEISQNIHGRTEAEAEPPLLWPPDVQN